MATTASRLSGIETLIDTIETALAAELMEEYEIQGRKYRRGDLVEKLKTLYELRQMLRRELARTSSTPVRVAKLGRARRLDR